MAETVGCVLGTRGCLLPGNSLAKCVTALMVMIAQAGSTPATVNSPGDYTNQHAACFDDRRRQRQRELLDKAEAIEHYDGWVFIDGVGPRDGYFESAEEAEDWIWDTHEEGDELPQWAFCCTSSPPPRLDLEDVTQRFVDHGYEGIEDDLVGITRLREALDLFWEENKHLISWTPDYSRKVRLHFEGRDTSLLTPP